MSYQDIDDLYTCVGCNGVRDRRGSHCSECNEDIEKEIEWREGERVRRPLIDKPVYSLDSTVVFLDDAFQKIFGPRK